MNDLTLGLEWVAAAALAGLVVGWTLGRGRQRRRIEQRVAAALAQVEGRHRVKLNNLRAAFARQAQDLKDLRLKAQLQEAADRLAQTRVDKGPALRDKPPPSKSRGRERPLPTLSVSQSVSRDAFAPAPLEPAPLEPDMSFAPTQPMSAFGN
jgi:hypothetical protein